MVVFGDICNLVVLIFMRYFVDEQGGVLGYFGYYYFYVC